MQISMGIPRPDALALRLAIVELKTWQMHSERCAACLPRLQPFTEGCISRSSSTLLSSLASTRVSAEGLHLCFSFILLSYIPYYVLSNQ